MFYDLEYTSRRHMSHLYSKETNKQKIISFFFGAKKTTTICQKYPGIKTRETMFLIC